MRAIRRQGSVLGVLSLVLGLGIGARSSGTEPDPNPYPKMAPIEDYLMEPDAEVLLARSAAPASTSGDATILVLGRQGYELAVRGGNGFVCLVERSWLAPFDAPEYWNPRVRGAECLNPQATRSILPITELRTRMVMAGRSKEEIVSALQAAFDGGSLPDLEHGAMAYMMSKSAYLFDAGDHNGPHLMFFTSLADGKDWGAGTLGSPVVSGPLWFLSPQAAGLPAIEVFSVIVARWSDGTLAPHASH